MLNKNVFFSSFAILSFILLPGCVKYYDLSKTEFPQGEKQSDERKVVADNLRTTAIYNQFETKAIFDVLWLSDETRTAFVDINCRKNGKDEQAKNALLRRQLEENKHWITFCVLADVRDKTHLSLTDKDPYWSLYLKLPNGENVRPISIKEVELEPEYQFLFGDRFNAFKRVYMVKFPATNLNGVSYLQDVNKFQMALGSPAKEKELEWDLIDKKSKKKVWNHDDYYWI